VRDIGDILGFAISDINKPAFVRICWTNTVKKSTSKFTHLKKDKSIVLREQAQSFFGMTCDQNMILFHQ